MCECCVIPLLKFFRLQVPVKFQFINKLNEATFCKSWLKVEPSCAIVNVGECVHQGLALCAPGPCLCTGFVTSYGAWYVAWKCLNRMGFNLLKIKTCIVWRCVKWHRKAWNSKILKIKWPTSRTFSAYLPDAAMF